MQTSSSCIVSISIENTHSGKTIFVSAVDLLMDNTCKEKNSTVDMDIDTHDIETLSEDTSSEISVDMMERTIGKGIYI